MGPVSGINILQMYSTDGDDKAWRDQELSSSLCDRAGFQHPVVCTRHDFSAPCPWPVYSGAVLHASLVVCGGEGRCWLSSILSGEQKLQAGSSGEGGDQSVEIFKSLDPPCPQAAFPFSYLSLYARSAFYVPENFKYFFVLIADNTGAPWLVTQRISCAGCFLFRSWSCLVKSHDPAFLRMHTLCFSVISHDLIHFCNYTGIHGSPPIFYL